MSDFMFYIVLIIIMFNGEISALILALVEKIKR